MISLVTRLLSHPTESSFPSFLISFPMLFLVTARSSASLILMYFLITALSLISSPWSGHCFFLVFTSQAFKQWDLRKQTAITSRPMRFVPLWYGCVGNLERVKTQWRNFRPSSNKTLLSVGNKIYQGFVTQGISDFLRDCKKDILHLTLLLNSSLSFLLSKQKNFSMQMPSQNF